MLAVAPHARADDDGARLVRAAQTWLAGLTDAQRRQAVQPLASPNRTDWHYVPRSRRGLALRSMEDASRRAARDLVAAALSATGYAKAEGVFQLEAVLQDALSPSSRRRSPSWRDPLLYHVSVFGRPAPTGAWALRVEGHHLSINVTVREGRIVSTTPLFFGASPSAVRSGRRSGLRPLRDEEVRARALVEALPPNLGARVIASRIAPTDVFLGPNRAARLTGQGVLVTALPADAQASLKALVRVWISSARASVADATFQAIDWKQARFVWLGSLRPGQAHSYRFECPTLILEYVNRGDHIHAVWRSYVNDFGGAPSARR